MSFRHPNPSSSSPRGSFNPAVGGNHTSQASTASAALPQYVDPRLIFMPPQPYVPGQPAEAPYEPLPELPPNRADWVIEPLFEEGLRRIYGPLVPERPPVIHNDLEEPPAEQLIENPARSPAELFAEVPAEIPAEVPLAIEEPDDDSDTGGDDLQDQSIEEGGLGEAQEDQHTVEVLPDVNVDENRSPVEGDNHGVLGEVPRPRARIASRKRKAISSSDDDWVEDSNSTHSSESSLGHASVTQGLRNASQTFNRSSRPGDPVLRNIRQSPGVSSQRPIPRAILAAQPNTANPPGAQSSGQRKRKGKRTPPPIPEPSLEQVIASIAPAENPPAFGSRWKRVEKDAAIGHMLDIAHNRATNGLQFDDRFREVARRMQAQGYNRNMNSVSNRWHRELREMSGFDERKRRGGVLTTSLQGKEEKQRWKRARLERQANRAGLDARLDEALAQGTEGGGEVEDEDDEEEDDDGSGNEDWEDWADWAGWDNQDDDAGYPTNVNNINQPDNAGEMLTF